MRNNRLKAGNGLQLPLETCVAKLRKKSHRKLRQGKCIVKCIRKIGREGANVRAKTRCLWPGHPLLKEKYMASNVHNIENETVLERADNKIVLKFVIPASSDFFDGHFPEYKLLPAVAQFEIITRFSRKYFGTQRYIPSIRRIKFSAPIRPDTTIRLDLTHNVEKGSVSFTMADFDSAEKIYSSGSFSVIDE